MKKRLIEIKKQAKKVLKSIRRVRNHTHDRRVKVVSGEGVLTTGIVKGHGPHP